VDQQTWIIKFNDTGEDLALQADTLHEFLLEASSDIEITQRPKSEYTQGGWVDLIITLVGTGGATKIAIDLINAIALWIKSRPDPSINIEIKEGHITKVEAKDIQGKYAWQMLLVVLKQLQDNNQGEEEQQ
jgi:Effector Associated Constant Component 1